MLIVLALEKFLDIESLNQSPQHFHTAKKWTLFRLYFIWLLHSFELLTPSPLLEMLSSFGLWDTHSLCVSYILPVFLMVFCEFPSSTNIGVPQSLIYSFLLSCPCLGDLIYSYSFHWQLWKIVQIQFICQAKDPLWYPYCCILDSST